jgi:hypothetical protein
VSNVDVGVWKSKEEKQNHANTGAAPFLQCSAIHEEYSRMSCCCLHSEIPHFTILYSPLPTRSNTRQKKPPQKLRRIIQSKLLLRKCLVCVIWARHSSIIEDSGLLDYDAVSILTYLSKFLRSSLPNGWGMEWIYLEMSRDKCRAVANSEGNVRRFGVRQWKECLNLLLTPPMEMEQSVPKRRHVKFHTPGNYQKEDRNVGI